MRRILLLIFISLCLPVFVFAQDNKVNLEDRIIGSTFKNLAKAFVAVNDIQRLKGSNIKKLNKMDDEKFQRKYAKVYKSLKALPDNLKTKYGITEHMTKKEVIIQIEALDKQKIYQAIDFIPDQVISNLFKQYLRDKKQAFQKSNVVAQVNKTWNRMLEKLQQKD